MAHLSNDAIEEKLHILAHGTGIDITTDEEREEQEKAAKEAEEAHAKELEKEAKKAEAAETKELEAPKASSRS